MYLASNIKFLRNYTHLSQTEFGKIFNKTRSNIDSYERGNARPDEETQQLIAAHFNISVEVLFQKDLKLNPGLMFAGASVPGMKAIVSDDTIKAKDETIKELKDQIKMLKDQVAFLQQQNDRLLKKLKVA